MKKPATCATVSEQACNDAQRWRAPPIDIRPDHWTIVRDILNRHLPQYEVWAFGSRTKGTARPYSDLDLAIIADVPLPLDVTAALAEDFSESDLPWSRPQPWEGVVPLPGGFMEP